MNILFFTSPSNNNFVRLGRCGGQAKAGEKWPPVKLMFAAGAVRDYGNVRIIDAEGVMSSERFCEEVRSFKPGLAVCEPTAGSAANDSQWAGRIKELSPAALTVATGAFASGMPGGFLGEFSSFDAVAAGEAENILRSLASGVLPAAIEGLWLRNGGDAAKREFGDFDELPFPAHDLIEGKIYTSPFTRQNPFTVTETSRGCPYRCIYCNASDMSGARTRFRSISNVSQELTFIRRLGFREVKFNDETFTIDRDRTFELSGMIARDHAGLTWKCNTRADLLDDALLAVMARAGCHLVYIGVESASSAILDYYRKEVPLDEVAGIVASARRYGISTVLHFMIGAPQETWETVRENIRFACAANPDFVAFNILTPYPGTLLRVDLDSRGLLVSSDWKALDQSRSAVIRTENLSEDDLVTALAASYQGFYLRPSYMVRRLLQMRSPGELLRSIVAAGNIFLKHKNTP